MPAWYSFMVARGRRRRSGRGSLRRDRSSSTPSDAGGRIGVFMGRRGQPVHLRTGFGSACRVQTRRYGRARRGAQRSGRVRYPETVPRRRFVSRHGREAQRGAAEYSRTPDLAGIQLGRAEIGRLRTDTPSLLCSPRTAAVDAARAWSLPRRIRSVGAPCAQSKLSSGG